MSASDPARKIEYLLRVILAAFVAVAVILTFWSVLRGPDLLNRDDNPRQVEAELRLQRGRIIDRDGVVLAESGGTPERVRRLYPQPAAGAAVGYYSFRYGTAGIEESYDPHLRGEPLDFWQSVERDILHRPQTGLDVRLTLDAELQATADRLLGENSGAIVLLQLPADATGAARILALASHPAYDPNRLDEQFELLMADESAPLLNRVTQGLYQPGLLTQPFFLAAAWEEGLIQLDDPVNHANRPIIINGTATYCATPPPAAATWADVLLHRCPGPMGDLADRLDLMAQTAVFSNFALTEPPSIPLQTEGGLVEPPADARLSLIGQDNLVVTPLQLGRAWAALAQDGRLPPLQLVDAVQDRTGVWQPMPPPEIAGVTAVSPETARQIHRLLPVYNDIREFSVSVLSGPAGDTNSWYLGFTSKAAPVYAVVVVLEESADVAAVERIGREMLTAVGYES